MSEQFDMEIYNIALRNGSYIERVIIKSCGLAKIV